MPTARAPITVEVTPINVKTNINVQPSTAAPIAPYQAPINPNVQVVPQGVRVPTGLKDAAVPTFGSRIAGIGKTAFGVGAKIVGVGLGVAADLAQDLIFPNPVGIGSDQLGGRPLGSPPTSPISDPRDAGVVPPSASSGARQPFRPPTTEPIRQPVGGSSTTRQPYQPAQPVNPPPAPFDPSSINAPSASPRSGLGVGDLPKQNPLKTDSPYPLNEVDINGYGGVNLAYPIAQKLSKLETAINSIKDKPKDAPIDFEPILQKIDTSIKDALSKAKIETQIKLPATTTLTAKLPAATNVSAKLPAKVDLTGKLPVNVDLATKLPVAVDLASNMPVNLDLVTKLPVAVDLASKLPVNVDLITKLPVAVDLATKLPVAVDLASKLPVNVDLATKLPVAVDLATKLPVNVDLVTKLPVAVDVAAKLTPEPIKPDLKKLQECCEDIESKLKDVQENLKKKAPTFEGTGTIVCSEGATPYSYRGEGLTGLHQLINIVLGVNKQILEKVCDFNIEYPALYGGGSYDCDGSTIDYSYSGVGFIGIKNQIDQLFGISTKTLSEVCEGATLPNIAGQIEYFGCDNNTQAILYSGNGIEGLSSQVTALTALVKEVLRTACDASCVPLMPDSRFEEFKVTKQLVITWGTQYPTQSGSLWHTSIPMPKDNLNWCDYFENLSMRKGTHCGRIYWKNSNIYTGGYFESKAEAERVLTYLVSLSEGQPHRYEDGSLAPRHTEGGDPKRKPVQQTLRAVRAVVAEVGEDGEPTNLICFVPPREGCP